VLVQKRLESIAHHENGNNSCAANILAVKVSEVLVVAGDEIVALFSDSCSENRSIFRADHNGNGTVRTRN